MANTTDLQDYNGTVKVSGSFIPRNDLDFAFAHAHHIVVDATKDQEVRLDDKLTAIDTKFRAIDEIVTEVATTEDIKKLFAKEE